MRTLEITTYINCPNRCSYCPQDLLIGKYKGKMKMSLDDFKKILANTPKDVDIHFSGFSEPFFHQDIVYFILEARKEHEVVVYTTTKGMSDFQIEQLRNVKFKQFVVHDIGGYKEVPCASYVAKIRKDNMVSRGGNLYDFNGEMRGVCSRSAKYEQNVVLPNGDVYLCCMDYGLTAPIGNLYEQHYNDLDRKNYYLLCSNCELYV